ncbi:hypothetical protein Q7C_1910 [Methylophaga frappieri]|uniref:Uncharacterized protein n=1 Tax=Methylophaga frappieri (strain ATCC BAA-2434 / DSM 25690 / JAM7) TaxID=754477 RepID=I1YJF8_METFJ|nr:hypothetical protein Q7C_1910 [Methylophaga frappieri]
MIPDVLFADTASITTNFQAKKRPSSDGPGLQWQGFLTTFTFTHPFNAS